MKERVDILIKGGMVYDGTGSEPLKADVGIIGDRIAFIDGFRYAKADKIIDAHGLAVSPGFIDTHSHSEFTLVADPRAEGKILQGVTTEINGNCGLSATPLYGEAFEHREEDLRELGISERWSTLDEYFGILAKKRIAINFATLTGHGNIRASVIGYEDRKPCGRDIEKMCALLREALRGGALGLSTGLIYPPGVYSDTEEIIELSKVLSQSHKNPPLPPTFKTLQPPFTKGGVGGIIGGEGGLSIYTSHMRSEGKGLLESIEEAIKIGEEARVRVHISHIKTSGEENWHKIDSAISLIEKARQRGIDVTCDCYPYTAASTDLDAMLPSWSYAGGIEEELKRLNSLRVQEKIKKEILREHPDKGYWERVSISSVPSLKNKWMEGKSMAAIAKHEGVDPIDLLFRVLIEERLRVGAIFFSMNEDNLKRFLSLPYTMIGSDSSARCTGGQTHKGKPHPRGFGSFPRFLGRYVRDEGLMTMSEAIHKITMLPAKTFGIIYRGLIREDAFADIVIFDPDKVIDRATFDEPFLKPEGIHYVIVNGLLAVMEGEITGRKSGRILKWGR